MRLATLDDGSRDGVLVLVDASGLHYCPADGIARTLQAALDDWRRLEPELLRRSAALNAGSAAGTAPIDVSALRAPLPRAYEWVDGSAYLNHILLVRKARGAAPPPTLHTEPLVYQGGSSEMLSPRAPLRLGDPKWGLDFEAEIAVILDDTPRGMAADRAADRVRLITLANDVTYRNLVPSELDKGFGFFSSKPATAFAPFAVTPDELGPAWRDGRVHLRVQSWLNGQLVGDPEAGDAMHFSFFDLIAHIARTRSFCAGTILGSGTVSNEDPARGVSCLAERRVREQLEHGAPRTPFLAAGDRVRITAHASDGRELFGSIEQEVRS
ncbi:MAG TPA: fumarylacetoacetate hydrolase family protein [Polyangiales bacterium]|nr:fumarylacetoacetate hydrolase family protein [Polyangiales bacterium]